MNNDLISRSALLEEINNFSMRITGSANAMALVIMDETKKSIMRMVEEQPTAYDVDKVVERLEAEAERWKESGEEYEDQKELGVSEGFKKAIEIVKSGGIE